MKSIRHISLLLLCACGICISSVAQKSVTISGVVVDSASLVALPGVNIRLKSTPTGTVTDARGSFKISAPVLDTLVFSIIGYESFEYPIYFEEEDILIRLAETIVMLEEVTTTSTRLPEKVYAERRPVKTLTLVEGFGSPFTYFSKAEKEKRKLVKAKEENMKVRTYVEVVNDPEFKKEMIAEFSITELQYNNLLANFNKENRIAQYLTSEVAIRERIMAYFAFQLRKN